MINNMKKLNMREIGKMINFMDLEKLFGKMELNIKEYFNLDKKNLDYQLIQKETNFLNLSNNIKSKYVEQCFWMEMYNLKIRSMKKKKVKLSEKIIKENSLK